MAQPPPVNQSQPLIRVLCASSPAMSRRWTALARQIEDLGARCEATPALPPEMRAELIERAAVETLDDDRSVLLLAPGSDQRRGPLFSERTHSSLVEFVTILKLRGRVAFIREREGDEAQLPEALRGVPVFEVSDGDSVMQVVEWARGAVESGSAPSGNAGEKPGDWPQYMAEIDELERRGDLQGAIRAAGAAYEHVRSRGRVEAAAQLLLRLAGLHFDAGAPSRAEVLLTEAESLADRIGDRSDMAPALLAMGDLYLKLGQIQLSTQVYEQALKTALKSGDRDLQWRAYAGIGDARAKLSQPTAALDAYQQALSLVQTRSDPEALDSIRARIASISAYETSGSRQQARPAPTGQTTQPPSPDSLSIAALSSFTLSPGARAALDRAKAMTPPGGRWATLTTLAFLFAFKELGRETPQTQDTFHFVHRYFDRQAGARYQSLYETTVRTWMEDSPPGLGTDQPPGEWVTTITANVQRLFGHAAQIATATSKPVKSAADPGLEEEFEYRRERIHARHLFAALLTFQPEPGSRNSVVEKLNFLGIDLGALKNALFEIVAANTVEDSAVAWRRVLGLSPSASPGQSDDAGPTQDDESITEVQRAPGGRRAISELSAEHRLTPATAALLDRAAAISASNSGSSIVSTRSLLVAFLRDSSLRNDSGMVNGFARRFDSDQARAAITARYPNLENLSDRRAELGTADLARVLGLAGRIGRAAWSSGEITPEALLIAVLIYEPEEPTNAARMLLEMGSSARAIREALLRDPGARPSRVDAEVWRGLLEQGEPFLDRRDPPGRAEESRAGSGDGPGGAPKKGGDAPAAARPASFLSPFHGDDNATDKLNLRHEIDALAYLIASHSAQPPLAIGLFGEWGSGKSFFMARLRERIAAIAEAARKADAEARAAVEARQTPKTRPEDIGWHRHICQIEFNAWHYVEGNIWASLVEHIFSNLRSSLVSPKASAEAQRQQEEEFRREFETSKHALAELESRINSARKDLENAQAAVASARDNHRLKAGLLGELKSGQTALSVVRSLLGQPGFVAGLRELGVTDDVIASPARVREEVQKLSAEVDAWRSPVSLLTGRAIEPRWLRWGLLALLLIAAPLAVALVTRLLAEFDREIRLLVGLSVQLAALCTAAVGWIGAQAGRLARYRAKLDPLIRQLEERRAEELVRTERDLAVAKTNLDQALADHAQQQKKVEELQAQEKAATATELMAQFIEQRAACTDYRRHLGITAIVRRDFAKLTELVARRSAEARGKPVDELDRQPIDRIVLYIDDLDRCPPDKVVAVLEAVHLILAFKLFVVVVGVDARWISRSLRKKYGPLLAGRASRAPVADRARTPGPPSAVPEDYLEKIFQIPFRLRPLSSSGTQDLLDHLIQPAPGRRGETLPALGTVPPGPPASAPGRSGAVVEPNAAAPPSPVSTDTTPGLGNVQPGPALPPRNAAPPVNAPPIPLGNVGAGLRPAPAAIEPKQEAQAPGVDLTPGRLELTPAEIAFMKSLAPVIGRSPRAVHRFVNCYRLLKAARDPGQLGAFESPDSASVPPYEAAMLMLALVIGCPEVAGPALSKAAALDPSTRLVDLIQAWDQDPVIAAEPEWKQRLHPWLTGYLTVRAGRTPIAPLRTAASAVARYSFRTGMMEDLETAAGESGAKAGPAASE